MKQDRPVSVRDAWQSEGELPTWLCGRRWSRGLGMMHSCSMHSSGDAKRKGKRTLEQGVDSSQAGAHIVLHPRVAQHVRHGRALRRVGLQHHAQQVRALGRHLRARQS